MPESFTPETLAALVLAHIDVEPASLRFTPIRTGKHNASYWIDFANLPNICYTLRWVSFDIFPQ